MVEIRKNLKEKEGEISSKREGMIEWRVKIERKKWRIIGVYEWKYGDVGIHREMHRRKRRRI